jgi:IGR protein motif
MATAQDFLIAIGRGLDKRIPVEQWVDLFRMKRDHFKKLGVGVRDRRYGMDNLMISTIWSLICCPKIRDVGNGEISVWRRARRLCP